jgi:hypothetical protein
VKQPGIVLTDGLTEILFEPWLLKAEDRVQVVLLGIVAWADYLNARDEALDVRVYDLNLYRLEPPSKTAEKSQTPAGAAQKPA